MSNKARDMVTDPYLSVGQVARELSVHPSTIRRWIDGGRLPAYRLGAKRIGVKRSDLARLVAPRPVRKGGNVAESTRLKEPSGGSALTPEECQRGLGALAELERLSAAIAARHGKLTPESWELIHQSRAERTRSLMQAVEE